MGGNNTKLAPATEWDKHRTSEQSSAIPYTAQIHTKYENNIQSLINNLHSTTEKEDYNMANFVKIINNTLSYNAKYQNTFDNNNVETHPSAPVPESGIHESPFLSPDKYANLLDSATSDFKQYGGGSKKDKKNKTKDKTHKMSKKYNKSSESSKQPKQPITDTSSTESNNKSPISEEPGDSNMSTPKETDTPDEDTNTPEEDTNTPDEDTNTPDDEKESEGNNKYQSPSPASDSVHTSQINMLDSY